MKTDVMRQPSTREHLSSLLLAGRFLKSRCLHQQGALQTWSGTDLSTKLAVVVKTVPLSALQMGAFERMRQDDAVLGDLRNPWLPPPLACGLERELLFRVSRYATGGVLGERLARGPLSLTETLQLGRGLLRALREAHAQRVSHRHLKPSNVVIAPGKTFHEATLLDFGLALDDLQEHSLGALPLSTLQYLAPEQLGLVAVEPGTRSDLYAVGLMLFECLAGTLPFRGETRGELLRQHLTTVPELRARGLLLPRAVEQVVQHLLREDPRERYQSAEAALLDLEAIASGLERGLAEPAVVVGRSDRRQQLTEPAFLARAPEVEELERACAAASQGQGGLVLVEAESGGGKTMLLDELERRGRARGLRVFRGQGIDRAAPQPLQTLSGVLRGLFSASEKPPELNQSPQARAEARLGAIRAACPLHEELLGVPVATCLERLKHLEEAQVVQALVSMLDALGDAETPALLLLDDCQWSDELTLKVLISLGRPREEVKDTARFITVVATFRTEEVSESHLLRKMDAQRRLSLAPFAAPDLRDLAESMAGSLPEEALDLVVQRAEGNPFMATSMVRGLVESGVLESTAGGWRLVLDRLAEVRSSRRAASLFLRRLALFSEETRSLLVAGAILGREFEVERAAVLARQGPERAVHALEGARRRHILWAVPSTGRYTFTHDRIREALLEQLPEEERRALHLAAAVELERRAPEQSFELAWHFEEAGAPERAWPHALKSAEAARDRHALDLAERYYRLADRGAAEVDGATRMAILEGLGDALRIRAKYEEAAQTYARAQAFAATRLDRARLEGRRGEAAFLQFDTVAAAGRMERALQLIGRWVPVSPVSRALFLLWALFVRALHIPLLKRWARRSPPLESEARLAARLLSQLAQVYWLYGPSMAASWGAYLRGLNTVEQYAPSAELATAYANHGTAIALLSRAIPRVPVWIATSALARGKTYFQRALALQKAFGDAYEHGYEHFKYQFTLFSCAQYAESAEAGRSAVKLNRQAGGSDEWRVNSAQNLLGEALFRMGDLTGAVAHGQAQYRLGRKLDDGLMCCIGLNVWARASEGLLPAEAIASELGRATPDLAYNVEFGKAALFHAEGLRLLRAEEPGRATAAFEQSLQHVKASGVRLLCFVSGVQSRIVTALRMQAVQVPACAFSVRAGLLRRARATAREVLRRPMPFRENWVIPLRELGLIAAMEGRNARARRYLNRGLAIAERLGMRYEQALTLRARAEVGTALGWPEAARDAAAAEELLRPMRAALEPEAPAEVPASLSLVDRFPRILETGRAIASALTREGVLSTVREAALGLLRGEACVLVEATSEGLSNPRATAERWWPFLLQAHASKRPVVPSTQELESAGCVAERSVLCAPILVRGQVAVVFCVTTPRLSGAFGPEEVHIASFIAALAGAALENAQGFAEVNAALRKRDEFLAVASHELRTPFTPMRLYLQGLLSALRDPARAAGLGAWVTKLETANTRLQRLAKLVEDLFDVSRLSQGTLPIRREQVDLAALTAEVVDRWKDELARVQCDCTLEATAPVVGHWDGLRLEQVIDNLLGNATKYGPGKPISLSVTRDGAVARLTVQDQGMGIAPEAQTRIFERFERAVSENYGGFGLGLWISREVLKAHGGRISVQSTPGQGATFTVELPLS